MGSTLPLLVAYQVGRTGSVGRSVGMLYSANTLGAAIGAFITVRLVFRLMGLGGALRLAVVLNLAIGLMILGRHLRAGSRVVDGSPT
jgi:hypothetical protein